MGTRGVGFITHTKKDLLLLSFRLYNLNEVLSMLEDDSDVQEASVFIEPPPVTEDTDEDSGEEDGEGTVSNLNGRQLRAPASATVLRNGQRQPLYEPENDRSSDEDGFKMWPLTTPQGYVVQCEPYQGATGRPTAYPGIGMGGAVVLDLISELQEWRDARST